MTRDALPTGEQSGVAHDVADPHPATEEDYDKIQRPGGVKSKKAPDIGPNSYAHDGKARPRPKNEGSKPE